MASRRNHSPARAPAATYRAGRPGYRLLVAALGCVLLLTGGPADATDFRALVSWMPDNVAILKIVDRFAGKVAEASAGSTRFTLTGPDVIPAFEQLQPVALGIFDVLFTHGAYHAGTSTVGLALDAIMAEPAVLRSSGVWDAVDAHYAGLGFKLLALPVSSTGHHLLLREPLDEPCELKGRRIRAAPVYHDLLTALGAIPVALPIRETGGALEKSVVDGVAWSTIGTLEHHWQTVCRYLFRPSFGSYTYLLLMNLDTWRSLGVEEQTILLAEGIKLEEKIYTRFKKVASREENDLKVSGMQTTELCGAALKRLPIYWADSVWAYAVAHGTSGVPALRELAVTAGITY